MIGRARSGEDAARIWWKAWRTLHPRFSPAMRTIQAAEAILTPVAGAYPLEGALRQALVDALNAIESDR